MNSEGVQTYFSGQYFISFLDIFESTLPPEKVVTFGTKALQRVTFLSR